MGAEAEIVTLSIVKYACIVVGSYGLCEFVALQLHKKGKKLQPMLDKMNAETPADLHKSAVWSEAHCENQHKKSLSRIESQYIQYLRTAESCMKWSGRLRQFSATALLPLSAFWLYLIVGAFIFQHCERETEEAAHAEFLEYMEMVRVNHSSMYEATVSQTSDPNDPLWRNWDFFGSLFYCFTLGM